MKLLIKLAIRNVHRYIGLSVLNGIGIAISVMLVLLILSLANGIENQIINRNIQFETGAISIFFDKEISSLDNKLEGDDLLSEICLILDSNKKIKDYYFRIYPTQSLLYMNDFESRVHIKGLTTTELFSLNGQLTLLNGDFDNLPIRDRILISNGLIPNYQYNEEDICNILQQTVDGTVNLNDYFIGGLFQYTSQGDKNTVYMEYDQAKSLYNCNLPSVILIQLNNIEDTDEIEKEIRNKLEYRKTSDAEKKKDIEYGGIKIASYKDNLGTARSIANINKYGMLGLAVFLIIISFVGIWSMQVENINDRKQEIGTLLSFGFSLKSVKRIFLYESIYISLIFSAIGLFTIVICITIVNANNGIYLGEFTAFAFGSAVVNPELVWEDIVITISISILYPLIAAILSLIVINKVSLIELLNE